MVRKLIGAAAVAVVALTMAMPASAAVNAPVALPGAELTGFATPRVVIAKAAPANFINLDAIGVHDFVSVAKRPNQQPWFKTAAASGPSVLAITGLDTTPAGDYAFVCTIHPGTMTGTVTIV